MTPPGVAVAEGAGVGGESAGGGCGDDQNWWIWDWVYCAGLVSCGVW